MGFIAPWRLVIELLTAGPAQGWKSGWKTPWAAPEKPGDFTHEPVVLARVPL